MKRSWRETKSSLFSFSAGGAVLLMVAALLIVLGPILYRGSGAVVFKETVEFRRMQNDMHGRFSGPDLPADLAKARKAREGIYATFDAFCAGIDTEKSYDQARSLYREFKTQIANRRDNGDITAEAYAALKDRAKEVRDAICDALESDEGTEAQATLAPALREEHRAPFANTRGEQLLEIARSYSAILKTVDLSKREEYLESLQEIKASLGRIFGPRPGEPVPQLAQFKYGLTRMDMVEREMENLLYVKTWVADGPGKPLRETSVPRAGQFRGTLIEPMLATLKANIDNMVLPQWRVYWQYFIDDSTPGYFFGGVGPEILGTLMLTVLAMVIAMPLGICAAAYLAECDSDGPIIRIIRTCINTLAGVPSIVFGLFGLACFNLGMQPLFGVHSGSTILAGGLTLALLILPVIIRASEEAIRSVPRNYKEGALALGAGRGRTFFTVTLPASLPGILTGAILSMGRAAGETAPILFTAAIAVGPIPGGFIEPTRTLSYGSYNIAVGDRIAQQVPHQQYGMVMTLILLVLVLNLAAIIVRSRVSKKLRGY